MATIAQIQSKINLRIDNGNNPISTERELWTLLLSQQFIGEVKWIKMLDADLTNFFILTGVTTGLGKTGTPYEGWAWCNGNNGTTDDDGLVSIAYGATYNTLGATGGSADAVVVAHAHGLLVGGTESESGYVGVGGTSEPATLSTVSEGVVGTDKNMQPYVVELKIQRIA